MTMRVAALYVASDGVYTRLSGVETWTERDDGRLYIGWRPVVAHPPCQLWTNFAALNFKRYGGEHNRPGNDGGCFASALANVRRCGGVLEHPAFSSAWTAHALTRPQPLGWTQINPAEWVCEVWQSAYGHKARKRTWLWYASPIGKAPLEANWRRTPGTHQCGWFDRVKPTLSKREASATPIMFAEFLVALARHSVELPARGNVTTSDRIR